MQPGWPFPYYLRTEAAERIDVGIDFVHIMEAWEFH